MQDPDPAASVRALFPGHYLKKFLAEGIRPDARAFGEARKTACAAGMISNADGSASVQVGSTSVVAGVRLSPFRPPAIGSATGRLVVVVDMGQAASSHSAARPDDRMQALSEFVTRTLQSACVLDEDSLIIKPGAAVWGITLTITCLNYDGNILDALLLVAVAALLDTRVPAVELNESGAVVECDKPTRALKANNLPVSLTVAFFENVDRTTPDMVVDPAAEEEKLCQATVTIVVALPASGDCKAAAHSAPIIIHKAGGLPVSDKDLQEAIQHARQRAVGTGSLLQTSARQTW
jgi:exosome complex component RRP43